MEKPQLQAIDLLREVPKVQVTPSRNLRAIAISVCHTDTQAYCGKFVAFFEEIAGKKHRGWVGSISRSCNKEGSVLI